MECTLGQFCNVGNLRSVNKVPFSTEFHLSKLESRVKLSQGKPRDLSRCNFQQVQIVEITKTLRHFTYTYILWSSLLSREVKKNPQNSSTSIHCMLVCLEQILFKLELFDWAMLSLLVIKSWGLKASHFATLKFQIFAYFEKVAYVVLQSIKWCL